MDPGRAGWACAWCGKVLHSEVSLDNHLSIHQKSAEFQCCEITFRTKYSFNRHAKDYHRRCLKVFNCQYQLCCFKSHEESEMKQHMSRDHCGVLGRIKPDFVCKICARSFSKSKRFKVHFKTCEEKLRDPLMRSGWIKCASSYHGLKGGGPETTEKVEECEDLVFSDQVRDPYMFEEDDPRILEFSSGRKRKREPTNLCQSLLFEVCDKSVEIALNSEKNLKNICDFLMSSDSKHVESQSVKSHQNDDEVLEDIFSKVLKRVDEQFSDVSSKSMSVPKIKLFQCLNCNLSSADADKLFNTLLHPCIGKSKLKCDRCNMRVKSGQDLEKHMRQVHFKEPILFLIVDNVESEVWKTAHASDNLCSKDCVRK